MLMVNLMFPVKMEMFRFLAPDSIIEHLGHTWAGYESLYSRASQAGATAIKGNKMKEL